MQAHDEVCGMTIPAETAAASVDFQGRTYYFCSDRCLVKFEEHPGWYVTVRAEAPQDVEQPVHSADAHGHHS